jgi:predicted ester cyclase
VQAQLTGFPDVVVSMGRRCEDGELYIGEFTVEGTNTGPIALPDGSEMPPTGKSVHFSGTEVVHIPDGKIDQHDMLWDRLLMLEQLGLASPS